MKLSSLRTLKASAWFGYSWVGAPMEDWSRGFTFTRKRWCSLLIGISDWSSISLIKLDFNLTSLFKSRVLCDFRPRQGLWPAIFWDWLLLITWFLISDSSSSEGNVKIGFSKSNWLVGILKGIWASWTSLSWSRLARSALSKGWILKMFSGTVLFRPVSASLVAGFSWFLTGLFCFCCYRFICEGVWSRFGRTGDWKWAVGLSWNIFAGSGTFPQSLKLDSLRSARLPPTFESRTVRESRVKSDLDSLGFAPKPRRGFFYIFESLLFRMPETLPFGFLTLRSKITC